MVFLIVTKEHADISIEDTHDLRTPSNLAFSPSEYCVRSDDVPWGKGPRV